MNYVRQEEIYGCSLACMAMILGISYKEIKAMWDPKYGATSGIAEFMRTSFLFTKGFISHTEFKCEAHTQRMRESEEWVKPFAPVHIAGVNTLNGPHAVVWFDEKVYDPNVPGEHKIQSYDVYEITGYWYHDKLKEVSG
jgi:hypothetical protein